MWYPYKISESDMVDSFTFLWYTLCIKKREASWKLWGWKRLLFSVNLRYLSSFPWSQPTVCVQNKKYMLPYIAEVVCLESGKNRKIHCGKQKGQKLNARETGGAIEYQQKCCFQMGERGFPNLKIPPPNPRLHYSKQHNFGGKPYEKADFLWI